MLNLLAEYRVTSPYGWRRLSSRSDFHAGIDLVKAHKAPINAFMGGTVLYAGMGKPGTGLNNYGNVVLIEDKNGRGHLYAHLDRVAVKVGATIKTGQVIGYQGNTGQVTGSHLHYEIRKKTTPLYGWESNPANSTLEPTTYLQNSQQPNPVTTTKYTVKSGDTLYSIAQKYNTTVNHIREANNINNVNLIRVGQVLQLPRTNAPVYYTVNFGDNLTKIAHAYNTTIQKLANINNISNINLLLVGQILRVK